MLTEDKLHGNVLVSSALNLLPKSLKSFTEFKREIF